MSIWKEWEVKVVFESKIEPSKNLKLYLWLSSLEEEEEYFNYRYNKTILKLIDEKVSRDYVNWYMDAMKERIAMSSNYAKSKTLK